MQKVDMIKAVEKWDIEKLIEYVRHKLDLYLPTLRSWLQLERENERYSLAITRLYAAAMGDNIQFLKDFGDEIYNEVNKQNRSTCSGGSTQDQRIIELAKRYGRMRTKSMKYINSVPEPTRFDR